MSFEISCYLRFRVIWICLRLLQNTIEWFRALRPISGWTEGRLSPFDGLLRAPYGANNNKIHNKHDVYSGTLHIYVMIFLLKTGL